MGFAIAAAALAAGGAIAASEVQKGGEGRADNALITALNSLKYNDIPGMSAKATAQDQARYKAGFDTQAQYDPNGAALRTGAQSKLLAGLNGDSATSKILASLETEAGKSNPQRDAIINQLLDGAQKELSAGATLPPEFQSELVRSGLEQTSGAGLSDDYRAAAGVNQRQLLGQAGINLQAFRTDQAVKMAQASDQLRANRLSMLSNTLGSANNALGQQQARQINAYQAGVGSVPAVGLTGHDITQLDLSNNNLKNYATLQTGNVQASGSRTMAALTGGEIQSGASFLSSALGGMGGGGGAGGLGGASQINSMGYQIPSNYFGLSGAQQGGYVNALSNANKINSLGISYE